jgi:glycosyltransferase involved in cell wall biosynthesis
MSGAETSQFAVVIPAYNESATIRDVAVRAWRRVPRVIVVDDGSEDGTAAVMEDLPVTLLRHPRNLGKASSLWCGMELALQEGATAVITLDGDGQHAPEEIPRLIAMHRRYPRSIVVGSRLHDKHKIPRARYYANRMANFWIAWAAGHHIPDSQSGFRLYPAEVLRLVPVAHGPAAGFVFESEILIEAGRRGMRSMAVPVTAIYGRHLRASHFRQVADIARITRMVAWKLLSRGLDLPGLIRSLRDPERVEPSHESRAGFRS